MTLSSASTRFEELFAARTPRRSRYQFLSPLPQAGSPPRANRSLLSLFQTPLVARCSQRRELWRARDRTSFFLFPPPRDLLSFFLVQKRCS